MLIRLIKFTDKLHYQAINIFMLERSLLAISVSTLKTCNFILYIGKKKNEQLVKIQQAGTLHNHETWYSTHSVIHLIFCCLINN
jgi:hypothetical protein